MINLVNTKPESLLQKPLQERRSLLRSMIPEVEGRLHYATSREVFNLFNSFHI